MLQIILLRKMIRLQSIFVEPQNKDGLKPLIDEYYKTIEEKQGASLFAVCRGKVSEGLDFADSRARAVIVIGLPYPPFYDPKVVLKRAYMDDGRKQELSVPASIIFFFSYDKLS